MDYALDTETCAFETDAIIINVGVVAFDRSALNSFGELISQGTIITIDRLAQRRVGRRETDEVLDWWSKQPESAREQLSVKGHHPSRVSLMLSDFMHNTGGDIKTSRWYCRGTHFDIAKLEHLFTQFEVPFPWHYRKPRCSRTALDEMGIEDHTLVKRPEYMVPHNSMHDAAFEAYMLQRASKGIKMEYVVR